MCTHRSSSVIIRACIPSETALYSFYYGDFSNVNATAVVKSPSVKLISTSKGVDADYADFLVRRRQNLATLPPEGTKKQIKESLKG